MSLQAALLRAHIKILSYLMYLRHLHLIEETSFRISKITSKAAPKTLQWKLRAKVEPAKKWYNLVEEVQRD